MGASNIGRFPVRINKSRYASSPSQLEMCQQPSQRIATINGLRSNWRLHKRGSGVGLMASYNLAALRMLAGAAGMISSEATYLSDLFLHV